MTFHVELTPIAEAQIDRTYNGIENEIPTLQIDGSVA